MSERSDGGPAYPQYRNNQFGGMDRIADGMSLRDHFATYAPEPPAWYRPSECETVGFGAIPSTDEEARYFKWRWYYADKMLAEREK